MKPWILLLFLAPVTAFAGDFVCHDPTVNTKFKSYEPSIDPGKAGADCSEVLGPNIQSQRNLVAGLPSKYLKVKNNLAEEMTQAEKDQADIDILNAFKQSERDRIDSGRLASDELLLGLDDLSKDSTVLTLIGLQGELSATKLKARIKKIKGL